MSTSARPCALRRQSRSTEPRAGGFVDEEARELREAVEAGDVVATADALADLAYVVYRSARHFGIDLDRVIAEVHRSNMTKSPAGDGKAIKGSTYEPPDLTELLDPEHDHLV